MNYRLLLSGLLTGCLENSIVAYEKPHLRGYHATIFLGALASELHERAEVGGAKVLTVHTSTLKKFATGNGKASKQDMIDAAKEKWRGFKPKTDDEADARWVMEWARSQA